MVSLFGAIFFPVASGTVVVCKNNMKVLGRSGRAGVRAEKEQGKPKTQNSDIGITPRILSS